MDEWSILPVLKQFPHMLPYYNMHGKTTETPQIIRVLSVAESKSGKSETNPCCFEYDKPHLSMKVQLAH